MSLSFGTPVTLRELSMRAVLVNGIPWGEEDESLPMKKEMEALERLPGNYTVATSSTQVTKVGEGVLSSGEARFTERISASMNMKKRGKISISKEMRGDPVVLWNIVADTESTELKDDPILAQPLRHRCEVGWDGEIMAVNARGHISGVKVEEEKYYKGEVEKEVRYKAKVEKELCSTREGQVLWRYSSYWELDSKGKLEVVHQVTRCCFIILFHPLYRK